MALLGLHNELSHLHVCQHERLQAQKRFGLSTHITVVIPAKNEEAIIESAIRTILQSDYLSSQIEVVALDDGSTDRTWKRMARVKSDPSLSGKLRIIRHERNYGKRVALASAIAIAHGEVIVCIDSDSFVERRHQIAGSAPLKILG